MAKIRHVTKQISTLHDGDQVIDKATEVEDHILNYYKVCLLLKILLNIQFDISGDP